MGSPEYRDRVDRMMQLALEHFGRRESATRWMLAPNWRLDRNSPIHCLRSESAWSTVESALREAPVSTTA
jgi:uncharacterized protein (DUF2384 family)